MIWLALPLLYVLITGPAMYVHSRTGWYPFWLFRLHAPIRSATEGTPAALVLDRYESWWIGLAIEHTDSR